MSEAIEMHSVPGYDDASFNPFLIYLQANRPESDALKYAEAMHDARALTGTLSERVWKQHFGSGRFLFLWSDIPGRYFCRYQELTEAPDVHWRDVGVGMGYRPPEGTDEFTSFIAKYDAGLSGRIQAVCKTTGPRNTYFEAYLEWFKGREEKRQNTDFYRLYLDGEALAAALSAQSPSATGMESSHYAPTGEVPSASNDARSRRTGGSSCPCSII